MRDTGYHFSKEETKQKISQGGDKKVMKKSLSVVLAAALTFASFGSLASAADLTAQEKFDALKAKGIFAGMADGTAGLDQKMTRAQFARVAGLLQGLDVDAAPTTTTFTDVKATHWAYQEVEAAVAAKILVGVGNNKFNPNGSITVQDLAVALANVLGLEKVEGATVEGASAYAAGYIKAVEAAGIVLPTTYKEAATREMLVTASFAVEAALSTPAIPTVSATATAAKKLTVSFNTAVDTAKAKVTVWNGTNQVNSKSVTFADDKKSAVVEFAFNLAAADYTVRVEGLSEKALTAAVKVEAEKVASIKFNSEKAALDRGNSKVVNVGYKVFNQYNEEINSTALSATAGKGTASAASGQLTLTSVTDYVLGEKVVVSLVHTGGTFATATVEVGSVAQASTVDIVKLFNSNGKELVAGNVTENFDLILDIKDQYGSTVTSTTYLQSDLIVTVSNPTAATLNGFVAATNSATFTYNSIDGKNQPSIRLAGPFTAGTSTVTIISKSSGAKDSFDIVVKEVPQIDTITLTAPANAPAGSKISIPFSAVDQFGAPIAHPTAGSYTSMTASQGTGLAFVKDVVKNVTNLELTLGAKGTTIITIITKTNKVAQLTINVVDAKTATVISGTKDLETALHKDGGNAELNTDKVVVKDQYGQDITPDWVGAGAAANGKYRVKVESSDVSKVTVDAGASAYATGTVVGSTKPVLAAVAKGNATITLTLEKYDGTAAAWKTVDNSAFTYNSVVVDKADIKTYAASVTGTVYKAAGTTYSKDLVVKGTLENGSVVTVPNLVGNYEVTVTTAGVAHTAGKVSATGFAFATDKHEADVTVLVLVKGTNAETIPVTFKVSDSDPVATTLSLKDSATNVTKEGDGVVSATLANLDTVAEVETLVRAIVKVQDQYGVELTNTASVIISNITDNHTILAGAGSTLATGDTFTATVITSNGKYLSIKVVAKANP